MNSHDARHPIDGNFLSQPADAVGVFPAYPQLPGTATLARAVRNPYIPCFAQKDSTHAAA